jgi:hypothetical protein
VIGELKMEAGTASGMRIERAEKERRASLSILKFSNHLFFTMLKQYPLSYMVYKIAIKYSSSSQSSNFAIA